MMNLIEIIEEWSAPEQGEWPRSISIDPPSSDLVTVITGVRRCGKSTLLHQLGKKWRLHANQCFFINFEDPRLSGALATSLLEQIFKTVQTMNPTGPRYFFFDEIQMVPEWEKWIRLRVDKPSAQDFFIVSGSNASLLNGDMSSVLTGRHRSYTLHPFSFAEFKSAWASKTLMDYLTMGGFPRVLRDHKPEDLLRQYFLDITERDLRERVRAKSVLPIQILLKCVFECVGSEVSLRRLATLSNMSVDTASLYLDAAEDAFLVFACSFFSYSERQIQGRNKKYYAVDTAMRRSIISTGGKDLGKDFENLVFLQLKRRYSHISYWAGEGEVDFVVSTRSGVVPIQVSLDQMKPRHEKALSEFYAKFPHARESVFVTLDNFEEFAAMDLDLK